MSNNDAGDYDAELDEFLKYGATAFGVPAHPDAVVPINIAADFLGVHPSTADRWEDSGLLEPKVVVGPNKRGRSLRSLFHHVRARERNSAFPRAPGIARYWAKRNVAQGDAETST
jgi:hypothetical protein